MESRYSQKEREMLAVVWGVEHFHLYVYGVQFSFITDHEPLIGIFKNHKNHQEPPCELKGGSFDWCPMTVSWSIDPEEKQKTLLSLWAGIDPSFTAPEESNLAEVYVNYVSTNAVPKATTLEEIKQEIKHDAETLLSKL